jgi:hypothetical protein
LIQSFVEFITSSAQQTPIITTRRSIIILQQAHPLVPQVTMVATMGNVLCIQLPKYHDNDDPISHLRQLAKVCATNGKNINANKLQYFPNSLKGKTTNWFAQYEITNPTSTWNEIQQAFNVKSSEVQGEDQAMGALCYVKQRKYELVKN